MRQDFSLFFCLVPVEWQWTAKKVGFHFFRDFCQLNDVGIKYTQSFHRIEESLSRLKKAKRFTNSGLTFAF